MPQHHLHCPDIHPLPQQMSCQAMPQHMRRKPPPTRHNPDRRAPPLQDLAHRSPRQRPPPKKTSNRSPLPPPRQPRAHHPRHHPIQRQPHISARPLPTPHQNAERLSRLLPHHTLRLQRTNLRSPKPRHIRHPQQHPIPHLQPVRGQPPRRVPPQQPRHLRHRQHLHLPPIRPRPSQRRPRIHLHQPMRHAPLPERPHRHHQPLPHRLPPPRHMQPP